MLKEPWQRNIAALLVAQTLMMIGFSFVFPFMPLFIQTMGVGGTAQVTQWAGVADASSSVAMFFAQPIWGSLADRWGRRPMVIRSMITASVILSVMSFVSSPIQLVALRVVQGAFSGTLPASTALIATSTPKHRLAFALGLMQVAVFLGNSVGPLVGGTIADAFGFRATFLTAGALMMVGLAIVITMVREDFTRAPSSEGQPSIIRSGWAMMTLGLFPVILAVTFMIQFGGVIIAPVLSLFIAALNGGQDAATAAGLVLTCSGMASAFSAVVVGRLSGRINNGMIIVVCLLGSTVVYFPQAGVQNVGQLLFWRVLLGLFLGGLMPTVNALLAEVVPSERRGVAFGLAASSNAAANSIGPLAGAGITTQWGMRAVFLATGSVFALNTVWAAFQFRRKPLAVGVREPQIGDREREVGNGG